MVFDGQQLIRTQRIGKWEKETPEKEERNLDRAITALCGGGGSSSISIQKGKRTWWIPILNAERNLYSHQKPYATCEPPPRSLFFFLNRHHVSRPKYQHRMYTYTSKYTPSSLYKGIESRGEKKKKRRRFWNVHARRNQSTPGDIHTHGAMWCLRLSPVVSKKKKKKNFILGESKE